MNIQQLAAEMSMPLADVTAFVNCLKVWTDKGLSIEDAITKHMSQMARLASNSHKLPTSIATETFFPS